MSLQSYEAIYHNGQVQWLGETPNVKKAKVIVTILEPRGDASQSIRRMPSVRIRGKGKILGDIMSPAAPVEEWNCAK
ncbi:hypothetical protein [Desulfonatronum thiodismutans]|uniref:hypothetical protein n=1 Tax=Desulfonatronum thiodismutans TaxID=159290 RepID=UPI0004ABD60D|nr:hypothetical protein [Desulfonatronum thiodismutans]